MCMTVLLLLLLLLLQNLYSAQIQASYHLFFSKTLNDVFDPAFIAFLDLK